MMLRIFARGKFAWARACAAGLMLASLQIGPALAQLPVMLNKYGPAVKLAYLAVPEHPDPKVTTEVLVTVEAKVHRDASLEVLNVKASNGDARFEAAVSQILPHIHGLPPVDVASCKVINTAATLSFRFTSEQGQPKVTVVDPDASGQPKLMDCRFCKAAGWDQGYIANFPRSARLAQQEGFAAVLFRVADAKLASVDVPVAYPLGVFERASAKAISEVKLDPAKVSSPEALDGCYLQVITYCLKLPPGEDHSFRYCQAKQDRRVQ